MNTSIDFTSFTQTILKILQEKLGSDYTVFSHCVKKNNSMERTGVVAKRKGQNASPTIYIDHFYKSSMNEKEVKEAADVLYNEFQKAEFEGDLDLSGFILFEKAKDGLCFKLICAKKNKELLASVPYRRFHDLAIVFYVLLEAGPYGTAAMPVKTEHLRLWRVTAQQVYEQACENTERLLPYEFRTIC